MSTKTAILYCHNCECERGHSQPAPNHVVHLILTLLTAGFWLIVWLIVAMTATQKWTCSRCGASRRS